MDKFVGKWQVTGTENMEEMLKAYELSEEKKQQYANMKFTMEYKRDGDHWTYTIHIGPNFSKTFDYTIGKPFEASTFEGRPVTATVEIKDNKLIENHVDNADPTLNIHIEREVTDSDELIVKATVRNVTSTTKHKRITE